MEADGRSASVAEMRAGRYPGDDELFYFAQALGGSAIVIPSDDQEHMVALLCGTGPIRLAVE